MGAREATSPHMLSLSPETRPSPQVSPLLIGSVHKRLLYTQDSATGSHDVENRGSS